MAPLNLSTRWRWAINFVPWLLYTWETTPLPIDWEPGWAPELVWTFGEEQNLLLLLGFEPYIMQSIAYSLYYLSRKYNVQITSWWMFQMIDNKLQQLKLTHRYFYFLHCGCMWFLLSPCGNKRLCSILWAKFHLN